MHASDQDLLRWVHSGKSNRGSVTLGQLILLLEMAGSDSVAAISDGKASRAVNYRQKLGRLERALSIGSLTTISGKSTQLTESGRRIAGEVRLLLSEMRNTASAQKQTPTWVVAAGEAWLQSVIVPALGEIAGTHPQWKWEVQNLRARDICNGVREGEIHFGFVRSGDIQSSDGLNVVRAYDSPGLAVVGATNGAKVGSARELIEWMITQKRPLVQQGSSWKPIRETVARTLRLEARLARLEPSVTCETHPQAVAAAEHGQTWCIVPAGMIRLGQTTPVSVAKIRADKGDEMALASNNRKLAKLPDAEAVVNVLKLALGQTLRGGE